MSFKSHRKYEDTWNRVQKIIEKINKLKTSSLEECTKFIKQKALAKSSRKRERDPKSIN